MTEWDEDRLARACLSSVVEPGNAALAVKVAKEGASTVWQGLLRGSKDSAWSNRARQLNPLALTADIESIRGRFVIPGDEEWPTDMDDLARAGQPHHGLGGLPLGLWVIGPQRLDETLADAVAIVGSRASTPYGERVASDFGAELAAAGHTIVSGGAYGIDASAHRGALSCGGSTVAFLASGLDNLYPRGNQHLLEQIAREGLVVTECGLGRHPTKSAFLARNRLIAAGSRGTVLVEAAARSGALNTMAWAHTLNRHRMVVPGPIHAATSVGGIELLRHGSAEEPVTAVAEAKHVEELVGRLHVELPMPIPLRPTDALEGDLLLARETLPGRGAIAAGDLAMRSGLPVPRALAALAALELRGLARQRSDGRWALDRPQEGGGPAG